MLCRYIFTQIYPLGTDRVYYFSSLTYLKSTYFNEVHIQWYVNLRFYTLIITLDMNKKYPKPKAEYVSASRFLK
jgi:hypothetical protein